MRFSLIYIPGEKFSNIPGKIFLKLPGEISQMYQARFFSTISHFYKALRHFCASKSETHLQEGFRRLR